MRCPLFRAARRERVRLHYLHRPDVAEEAFDVGGAEPPERVADRVEVGPPLAAPAVAPPAPVSRVRQALVSSGDEQPVSRADVLRGYEVAPDHYVVMEREELRRLQRKTSPTMDVTSCGSLSGTSSASHTPSG